MNIKLDPEFQYQFYLGQSGLDESKMHPNQKIERRRTFFAAYGMALKVCESEAMFNNKGLKIAKLLFKKLADFFAKEAINQNQN